MKRQNRWLKKRIQDERAKRGNRCAFCHSTEELEFAHVHPTGLNGKGRGRAKRYYDIIKNPASYVLACHNCHTLMDAGKIDTAV